MVNLYLKGKLRRYVREDAVVIIIIIAFDPFRSLGGLLELSGHLDCGPVSLVSQVVSRM